MQSSKKSPISQNTILPRESERFWQKHFNQYQQSHLSKASYARQHNLTLHRFLYWSRKLEKTDSEELKLKKDCFIPVKIQSDMAAKDDNKDSTVNAISPKVVLCTLQLKQGPLLIHTETALKVCLEGGK